MTRRLLCLDWDKRSLRIVVARAGRGTITLEDAHPHRLPPSVDADDPQAMGAFIQQMLKRHRVHQRQVVLDVSREKAVINRLTLPPTPFEELAAAVRFRAMQELPFPLDSAAMDFVIMKRDENRRAIEVLMAAVPLETLDRLRQTCAAAGLTPERIGLRPYANLTGVKHLQRVGDKRVLFVDVGPVATEIDVIAGDALAFTRSANVAVPLPPIEPTVERESQILKLVPLDDAQAGEESVSGVVEELLLEVTRTLQAYRAMEPDAVIDLVLLAGRTGIEAQLLTALDQRLGLPAEMFDPTEALRVSPAEADKLRPFAAALGLAWSAGRARDEGETLDFLNPKRPIPPRAGLKRKLRTGTIAAGVVLAAGAGVAAQQYCSLSSRLGELRTQNSKRAEQLRPAYDLLDYVEFVEDEWGKDAVWAEKLLALHEAAIEPGKQMLVSEMTLDRQAGTITLGGVLAVNHQVPAEFADKLNAIEQDGRQVFNAKLGRWKEVADEGGKFKGKVDAITIELTDLKEHDAAREKREKMRKDRKNLK